MRAHSCTAAVQHQASLCLCWQWCEHGWPVVLVVCAACCAWSVLDILLPSRIDMLVGFMCAVMQRLTLGAMLPRASLLQELLQKHIVCTVQHGGQAAHCACSESAVGQQLPPATCDLTAEKEGSQPRGALEKAEHAFQCMQATAHTGVLGSERVYVTSVPIPRLVSRTSPNHSTVHKLQTRRKILVTLLLHEASTIGSGPGQPGAALPSDTMQGRQMQ